MALHPNPRSPGRKSWSQPLADLVGAAIDPVLAKQGFGESSIILNWNEIVGPRIAKASDPLKLQWPPRGPKSSPDARLEPATLIIKVEGSFALELQHQAQLVIERVNAHVGWRCIGKLAMRQGPLGKRARERRVPLPMDPLALATAGQSAAGIVDEALREAVTRLGARVLKKR